MSDFEKRMRQWGSFVRRTLEHPDELGENILYRCALLQGRDSGPEDGHKILCADYPKRTPGIWETERAVRKLPNREEKAVRLWYGAPLKLDGNPYTKRELAHFVGVQFSRFDEHLRSGRRVLKRALDTVEKTSNIGRGSVRPQFVRT